MVEVETWVQTHGTPELQRALKEGYRIRKGVATLLVDNLADAVDMDYYDQVEWLEAEERTSPSAESFQKRDAVLDAVRALQKPEGWCLDVSRISRIALPGSVFFTGVVVNVFDETRRHHVRAAIDFESKGSE